MLIKNKKPLKETPGVLFYEKSPPNLVFIIETQRAVLDESQFFLKDFQNVSDGFVFEISQYRFFFNSDESAKQKMVRIQTLMNNKEYSTTESMEDNNISVEAIEQGRELASFHCRTN